MTNHELLFAVWRKSSHSGSTGGECVEVTQLAHINAVRDSKNPEGGTLVMERTKWNALLSQIKQGAYDL